MKPANPELWRPVDGWHGYYEVSTRGRVRSVARVVVDVNGHRRRVPGRVLKLSTSGGDSSRGGGPRCTLARGCERVTFYPRPTSTKGITR
jgi:NUMOD4 motif